MLFTVVCSALLFLSVLHLRSPCTYIFELLKFVFHTTCCILIQISDVVLNLTAITRPPPHSLVTCVLKIYLRDSFLDFFSFNLFQNRLHTNENEKMYGILILNTRYP